MRLLPLALLLGACAPGTRSERPQPSHGVVYEAELTGQTDAEILEQVFDNDNVQRFELEISDLSWGFLLSEPQSWRPATFRWGDLEFEHVGVRIKGNGSFRTLEEKPSLKIEFDKFADGQSFFGVDVLVLNNMISDHTKVKERLAYELYREAGVPAPRTGYSTLLVNGMNYGLYIQMEDVDERMLAHSFENPNGPLYELFDGVLQPDLIDGPAFELESGPDDRTVLHAAAAALALPTREEQIAAVEAHVDMEAFLTYYAVSGYIGQFDAWPFNDPSDDVHLYIEPTTQKIHPLPHGLDESFRQYFRNVNLPGQSLLGQACYFTEDCSERLARRTWEIHDLAQEIDLVGTAEDAIDVVNDPAWTDFRDETATSELVTNQTVLIDYLTLREERLLENLGDPP